MARLLRGYLNLLETHPFKTQIVTTGILMAAGDVVSQTAVEGRNLKSIDMRRTGKFFIFGICIAGPALRGWYVFLDKFVKGPPKIAPLMKLSLDQFTFAPCFIGVFLSVMDYWKTKSVDSVKQKLSQSYTTVLINNYKLWPAAQLINFYFLPLNYRILYVNCVAIFWNTYLAYESEASPSSQDKDPEES